MPLFWEAFFFAHSFLYLPKRMSESEYNDAVKWLVDHFGADLTKEEEIRFLNLAEAVEKYEDEHHIIQGPSEEGRLAFRKDQDEHIEQ